MLRTSTPSRDLLAGVLVLVALALLVAPRAGGWWSRAAAALTPEGAITRIGIPSIRVDSRVVPVERVRADGKLEWQVAGYAVGHHAGSGLPGGGTNIVLSGHNNVDGEVFRRLDELDPGDLITLTTRDGTAARYRVSYTRVLLEEGASREQQRENASYMRPTEQERLTVISCWPYRPDPPYRIIVVADPE